jgi:uncharacterized protein (DUF4415 family)
MDMRKKKPTGAISSLDPADDAPLLTREWFEGAEIREGERLIRRGRPKLANPRRQISVRLAPHVIDYFQAMGQGWQTKLNAELEKIVARHRKRTNR